MNLSQLAAVYTYLCTNTKNPQTFHEELGKVETAFNDPIEAVLYLPMYSMGLGQAAISPRIAVLRTEGFKIADVGKGRWKTDCIAKLGVGNNTQFGMKARIEQLLARAKKIDRYGTEKLKAALKPPRHDWATKDLVEPFTLLSSFTGIGAKAALHILMDIGWGVVKPDRHICRFLSRLGGQWEKYFAEPGTTELLAPLMLPFVTEWRDTCSTFKASGSEAPPARDQIQFKPFADLSLRQLDILIMWFTQDRGVDERNWRPEPICGSKPECCVCPVPGCSARKEKLVLPASRCG